MTKTRKPRAPKFLALLEKEKALVAAKVEDESTSLAMGKYVASLGKYVNKPLAKILEALEKDGATASVMGMTVAEVFGPMFAPGKGKRGRKKAVAAGGRLTKEENLKIQAKILEFVKGHPDCKRKEIAQALKLDKKQLFSPMKALMAEKKFATKGQKAGMTYSVK